jgi:predicted transport protein
MGDIKLFEISGSGVRELEGHSVSVEKSLQTLVEKQLEPLLGVRFLASEYSTGKAHGGRIDTLGIDENGCPVIIEYKRALNENVIHQGLFYLDWLMDHRGDFELLVLKRFGEKTAATIEWSAPRLLCIAGDFTKYDEHAVQQISRNIELIRYRRFGDGLLLFELVNASSAAGEVPSDDAKEEVKAQVKYATVTELLQKADTNLRDLFEALKAFLMALGDDVQMKTLKFYFAFKRFKNFACVEVHPQAEKLLVYVKVNPDEMELEKDFARDVRKIGHFGTGDLEISIRSEADLERAKPLILQSYEAN